MPLASIKTKSRSTRFRCKICRSVFGIALLSLVEPTWQVRPSCRGLETKHQSFIYLK